MIFTAAALFATLLLGRQVSCSTLPNIVFMLTDDLGWNTAWNNNETITPTLDELAVNSLLLDSFYVYQYCAPTRGSFLTGRFPYKLSATRSNYVPPYIPDGINLGYTMLPKKLAQVGYVSYHVGKWHLGMYTPQYTPLGRGFNSTYGFLAGGEDHFNQHSLWPCDVQVVDLWNESQPALGENGTYNGFRFTEKAVDNIKSHSVNFPDQPFFLYFALHNTHGPVEAPDSYTKMYDFNQTLRNTFDAMVSVVDESVKNVTETLKTVSNYWNNTLFVWATDNGAEIKSGGSNMPFKGGKRTNFEGGVHVPALVSGGVLPSKMKGMRLKGMMHITDLFATFCHLAGVDANDSNPDAPSGIDSINMWPYLTGEVTESPRNMIVHDHLMYTSPTTGAIRYENYKLIVNNETEASWYGQFSPNETWKSSMADVYQCSVEEPCLFDIEKDPTEHEDVSKLFPNVTQKMLQLFYSLDSEYHPPKDDPPEQKTQYCQSVYDNGDFCVPWVNVTL